MSNWRFIVILGMIFIGIGIIPVSAGEIIHDETFSVDIYKSSTYSSVSSWNAISMAVNGFVISTGFNQQPFVYINDYPESSVGNYNNLPQSGAALVNYYSHPSSVETFLGTGTFSYFKFTMGENKYLRLQFETDGLDLIVDDPNITFVFARAQSGYELPQVMIRCNDHARYRNEILDSVVVDGELPKIWVISTHLGTLRSYPMTKYTSSFVVVNTEWKNRLFIEEFDGACDITIIRNLTGAVQSRVEINSAGIVIDEASVDTKTYRVWEHEYPFDIRITSDYHSQAFVRNFMADATPTPIPIPEPELTYPVTVNFRHKHDNSLITDVYYQIYDLKPTAQYPYGRILYSGWSDTGTINIELEHRSMDDPNFPQQYLLGGKKYGYYDGKVIVSHLTAPYTFNVIMEDSSVTPTVDTNLIEFRIQERFSDSYINEAILTIYDCESEAEVYNETVTGGIVKVRLNQTDTGYAYPHYRVNVYSEGYADFTEYILALYQDGIMRCRLTKVTTPLDPGNVILHVYTVRLDSNDNVINIPNVKVTVGGIEKVTNSAGYTWFEVPKNSTQMYTAEHPQYAVMSGSVLVEEGERFLHIWMQPPDVGVTPTSTVIIPTPTPDYSIPTGPIDAVYNLFSMLGIPTLFIGFILTALIAIGCMIFAESFAEGTGLYAGILGVLISAGMGLIPLWIIIAFIFIGGIFYMKVMRGDG